MSANETSHVRRPTMRDIAEAAGVPVSAVALALARKPGVSVQRRATVLRIADELGYERGTQSQRLLYGLVMEELSPQAKSDGFIDTLIQGVYSGARVADAQVMLGLYHPGIDPLAELAELAARPLDGVIVANGGDITVDVIDQVAAAGIPMVLVENRVDRPISSVSSDNIQAGIVSTQHLLGLGHRRIGVIEGSERYVSLHDRYRGYLIALGEAGIPMDPELAAAQAPHEARKGYTQACRLLDLADPPTALYAVSDRSAMGALAAVIDRGLRPGIDVSIVGTDNLEESGIHMPGLTTFDTSSRDLGAMAVRQLAALATSPMVVTHTTVAGRLVVRETSGTAPHGIVS